MWYEIVTGPQAGRRFFGGPPVAGEVRLEIGPVGLVWVELSKLEACDAPVPVGFRRVLWAQCSIGDEVFLPAELGYGVVAVGPYKVSGRNCLLSNPYGTKPWEFEWREEDLCKSAN